MYTFGQKFCSPCLHIYILCGCLVNSPGLVLFFQVSSYLQKQKFTYYICFSCGSKFFSRCSISPIFCLNLIINLIVFFCHHFIIEKALGMQLRKTYIESFFDTNKITIERNSESRIWVVFKSKQRPLGQKEIYT